MHNLPLHESYAVIWFRLSLPFFLGLIVGQYTCNGFWLIMDYLSGAKGNQIFWI
ncbi:hypothetical protein HRbin16_01548 [bacterium HR16]|nr:hypothetical protein HRbin16_01548 [bacterium HR16]